MFSGNCKCEEKAYHFCQLCSLPFCSDCEHKHEFSNFSKLTITICEECESNASFLYCCSCEQHLCHNCDTKIHNKGKRAKHSRNSLYKGFEKAKVLVVSSDFHDFLLHTEKCVETFYLASRTNLSSPLNASDCTFLEKFSQAKNFALVHSSMVAYFEDLAEKVIKLSGSPNRKASSDSKSNEEQKVSSTKADKSSFTDNPDRKNKSFSLYCSNSESFEATPQNLKKTTSKNFSLANSFSRVPGTFDFSKSFEASKCKAFVFPLAQKIKEVPVMKSMKISHSIQKSFMELAEEGELLVLESKALQILKDDGENKEKILEEAVSQGIIRKIVREFSPKFVFKFYSLSLDYLSALSLKWVIVSLRKDMLTPNERLILSRIKESFGLKISSKTWEKILASLSITCKNTFVMSKQTDPFIDTETTVVYLSPGQWPVEDCGTIDDQQWKVLVDFLDSFYTENDSIPGGRYGCAQFIKLCGPESLKIISLGKLNLLVQEAINKNVVRYHRTLLIKCTQENEGKMEDEKVRLIEKVKAIILEILQENPNGVCLAQLPLFLKKKIGHEISFPDIGFPKLKNFLSAMDDKVLVEMMGTNNSFAILKDFINKTRLRNKNISNVEDYLIKVMTQLTNILKENPFGIKLEILISTLNTKLGFDFNPRLFNCPDIYTFITHFGENLMEIVCRKSHLIVFPKDMRTPPGFRSKKPLGLNPNSKPFEIPEEELIHKKSQSTVPTLTSSNHYWTTHTKNYPSYPESSLSNFNYENPDQFSYDSKQTVKFREESNVDIKENLKFIEELLQENENDEKSLRTFFEKSDSENLHTPQLSIGGFGMISGIKEVDGDSSQWHSKALSGDFGEAFVVNNIKALQHYRFRSNVEEKNPYKFY